MTLRLVLLAYVCLGGVVAAAGRAWLAVPLTMIALLAAGELWLRALAGPPGESGVPAARTGFAAVGGVATLPLVALGLHAAGQPVRTLPLAAGGAVVVTILGLVALVRIRLTGHRLPAQRDGDRSGRPPAAHTRTAVAVIVPAVLVLAIGGVAVRVHLASPRPAEPGYLSVALGGWAARIDRPVTVPPGGLTVPVRVTSSGIGPTTAQLRLRVGGHVVTSRAVTVPADTAQSMAVRVPALPPDGCLRAVHISVGRTSAGFYAQSPSTRKRERTAC